MNRVVVWLWIPAFIITIMLGTFIIVRAVWIDRKIVSLRKPVLTSFLPLIDGDATPPGNRVLLIGDSRISQWPHDLLKPSVINRGIPGETLSHLAVRFRAELTAYRPSEVVIASGINDLIAASFMTSLEARKVSKDVQKTLEELAKVAIRSHIEVYIATIVPPGKPNLLRKLFWSNLTVSLVADLNKKLRSYSLDSSYRIVDLDRALNRRGDGYIPQQYVSDTLHVNRDAYLEMTKELPKNFINKTTY